MCVQAARLRERLLANRALKRLLASMSLHVLHQFAGLLKSLPTYRTLVQINRFRMQPHVFGQQVRLLEAFVAIRTWIWIAFSVGAHMQYKATRVDETFIANITLKWLDCRVRSHMHHKATGLRKRLRANGTFVWFLTAMNTDMSVEAADMREGFSANTTLVWFVLGMRPDMLCQITSESEGFFALCTLKEARSWFELFNILIVSCMSTASARSLRYDRWN